MGAAVCALLYMHTKRISKGSAESRFPFNSCCINVRAHNSCIRVVREEIHDDVARVKIARRSLVLLGFHSIPLFGRATKQQSRKHKGGSPTRTDREKANGEVLCARGLMRLVCGFIKCVCRVPQRSAAFCSRYWSALIDFAGHAYRIWRARTWCRDTFWGWNILTLLRHVVWVERIIVFAKISPQNWIKYTS